jgi:hypothetical protein
MSNSPTDLARYSLALRDGRPALIADPNGLWCSYRQALDALLVREAVAPQVNEVVPLDCTALVAREGWDCAACGHRHAGRTLANICIGCPCPETSPRLAGEAVAPPSPAEVAAGLKIVTPDTAFQPLAPRVAPPEPTEKPD